MNDCKICGSELLPAHRDIGICVWCMIEIDKQQKFIDSMPVPCYYSDVEEEAQEETLPQAEDYM